MYLVIVIFFTLPFHFDRIAARGLVPNICLVDWLLLVQGEYGVIAFSKVFKGAGVVGAVGSKQNQSRLLHI